MKKQFLWLAFSPDDHQLGNPLRFAQREMLDLKFTLSAAQVKFSKNFSFNISENINDDELRRIADDFGNELTLLHFSGHATETYLQLAGGAFTNARLNRLLTGTPNLQLLFLNACSTLEAKELLRTKGIKNIIATSKKIPDKMAFELSVSFYKQLLNGRSIKEAFETASAAFEGNLRKYNEGGVFRGLETDGPADDDFPWGLYWDAPESAEWVPFPESASEAISPEKQHLLLQLDQVKTEMANELEEVSQYLGAPMPDGLRTQILKPYNTKLQEAEKICELLQLDTRANHLKSALIGINYFKQVEFFDSLKQELSPDTPHAVLPSGAYIIRGTGECALGLLISRIEKSIGVNTLLLKPKRIDFGQISEPAGFWQKVSQSLTGIPDVTEKEKIPEKIAQRFLGIEGSAPLVFVFDNVQAWDRDLTRLPDIIVNEFWKPLDAIFSEKLSRNYYLFIIDRGVTPEDKDGFPDLRDYESLLDDMEKIKEGHVFFPPVNPPLEDIEFKAWCLSQPEAFYTAINRWQELLDQSRRVKPTIIKVIDSLCEDPNIHADLINHLNYLDYLKYYDS